MFSICKQIIERGRLDAELSELVKAERQFTREIGVLERRFYQCIQQPYLIWANTKWTSEKAHNTAAAAIMKVRTDDRVASAYFRPGLYFEVFAREIKEAALDRAHGEDSALILVCHGLVADKHWDGWQERFVDRTKHLADVEDVLRCRTFVNYYCPREFVGFLEWRSGSAYDKFRNRSDRTIEELLFVGERDSELAAYIQYECNPFDATDHTSRGDA